MIEPPGPLFTIGYEATTVDRLIACLRDAGVATLADVRAIPQSRKPGFSKRGLAVALNDAGIEYVHLRALGTPKDGRTAARRGDGLTLGRIFEAHLCGDAAQAGLADVTALSRRTATCLLCFERDYHLCHRAIVGQHVVGVTGATLHHLQPATPMS